VSWEAVAAIAQILGSLAVLVTLVYLAAQVKHARIDMRRSLSHARATDERLGDLLVRAGTRLGDVPSPFRAMLMERAGLTDEEAAAIEFFMIALWQTRVETISFIDELPPGERAEFEARLMQFSTSHLFAAWYRLTPNLNPDAVRFIDEIHARSR
jgi:hypothetical protein